jgi:hypothetical protein
MGSEIIRGILRFGFLLGYTIEQIRLCLVYIHCSADVKDDFVITEARREGQMFAAGSEAPFPKLAFKYL